MTWKFKKYSFPRNLFSLCVILTLINCSKDDKIQCCGCNSEKIYTIPNQEFEEVYGIPPREQMTGKIFFKHPEVLDPYTDNIREFQNKFWIFQGIEGCGNCKRIFIVCNEDSVDEKFKFLKQEGVYDSIPVQFSGDVLNPDMNCIEPFITPSDINYAILKLDAIL